MASDVLDCIFQAIQLPDLEVQVILQCLIFFSQVTFNGLDTRFETRDHALHRLNSQLKVATKTGPEENVADNL